MLAINTELGFCPYIGMTNWQINLADLRARLDLLRS